MNEVNQRQDRFDLVALQVADHVPAEAGGDALGVSLFLPLVKLVDLRNLLCEDLYAAFAEIARHCERGAGDFVVSSDVDLELALNGRISVPSWQTGFLARKGTFPAEAWRADLVRPRDTLGAVISLITGFIGRRLD